MTYSTDLRDPADVVGLGSGQDDGQARLDLRRLEQLLAALGTPRDDLPLLLPLLAPDGAHGTPFHLRVGDWHLDAPAAVVRAVVNGAVLTAALAAHDAASIPATVLSVAVPLLFDVRRVRLSAGDRYVYAVLLDGPDAGRTVDDLYDALPRRLRGELDRLEFRDVIERLQDVGLAETDVFGAVTVERPSRRRLVRLRLPSPTRDGDGPPPQGS
jgi:hypothetical protein